MIVDVAWSQWLKAPEDSGAYRRGLKLVQDAMARGRQAFPGRRTAVADGLIGYELATGKVVTRGGWYKHPEKPHIVGEVHGWVEDGIVFVREIHTEAQWRKVEKWRYYSRWHVQGLLMLTGAPWVDEYRWFTPNKKQAQRRARAAGLNPDQYHKFQTTEYVIVRHLPAKDKIQRIVRAIDRLYEQYGPTDREKALQELQNAA